MGFQRRKKTELCVHKSTYIKRKKQKYYLISWWVGKNERVHRGPNNLEDIIILRHKWPARNRVAMGTTAIR